MIVPYRTHLITQSIDAVFNLITESQVDTSIFHSEAFMQTNIVDTYQLLMRCLEYWYQLARYAKVHSALFVYHQ
ncbi:hypothetical protein VCRA2123E76_100165 [Vibrio crassostreae]|nr:hypothetical protein VCRA2123E76_100165 [Vibrio crassostreae]